MPFRFTLDGSNHVSQGCDRSIQVELALDAEASLIASGIYLNRGPASPWSFHISGPSADGFAVLPFDAGGYASSDLRLCCLSKRCPKSLAAFYITKLDMSQRQ